MGRIYYMEQSKREAVRLVKVSCQSVPEVAADLGVGRVTLNCWIKDFRDQDLLGFPHEDAHKKIA